MEPTTGLGSATTAHERDWSHRRRERWSLIAQRAAAVGMAGSLVLHAMLIGVFAFVRSGDGGGGGGGSRGESLPIEVAVISESELASLNEGSVTLDTPGVEELKQGIDLAPMPAIDTPGGDALPDVGDVGGNAGGGLGGSGTGTGIGVGTGTGGSGAGGTSFFGVAARGVRFAYIVDVSGSMAGEKIAALKAELIKSLSRLSDDAQFVIIPFESNATPLMGSLRYTNATQKNKGEATREIRGLNAAGGTTPFPGFQMVLGLRPRPDAIYFMTDGQFDQGVPEDVRRLLWAGRNVPIHCICFVDNSSEEMMKKIAAMSDGTYTFVPAHKGQP